MKEKIYVYSDDTSTFPIHKGIYIHKLDSDEFFTIEEGVGTLIWSQLDGSKCVGQIVNEVARLCRCNVDDISDEIYQFIQDLLNSGIIEEKK